MNAQELKNTADEHNMQHINGLIKHIETQIKHVAHGGWYNYDLVLPCDMNKGAELKQYFDNLGFQTTYRRSLNGSNIIFSIRWDGEQNHIDMQI